MTVELGPRSYEIVVVTRRPERFGAFARAALERDLGRAACRRALIVTDAPI